MSASSGMLFGPEPDSASGVRGRVVMLTDNAVVGDSRVQKSARSAAEAGWEVILIGAADPATEDRWRIGGAEVRLYPLTEDLAAPYYTHGRSLRRPLAYPPGRVGGYRLTAARARRADITARVAAVRAARASGGSRSAQLVGHARLVVPRVATKLVMSWTTLRNGELKRLRKARRKPGALLNVLPVKLVQWTMRERAWRRLDPSLWQYELAFGSVIDKLKPDIIHAHDWKMVGVGARAMLRARARGRTVKFVWDAHEYVPGLPPRSIRWLPAQCAYEREYAGYADAVITVSEALADLLKDQHGLPERPTVALNAPVSAPAPDEVGALVPNLRELCGVGPSTPLLAYCGGITPVRGVDLMIEALPDLPDIHLALMSLHPSGRNSPADPARELAELLGVADRVHFLPYVPHWQVSQVLATADAAVSPLIHLPNHEIALSNKFFEYSKARLPLIVSDTRTMADMVKSTGQGEVFRAKDKADYVRVVRLVLSDPQRYRAAYATPGLLEAWTWEAQAAKVDALYTRLAGRSAPVDDLAAVA